MSKRLQTLVVTEVRDADGLMYRAVTLDKHGVLRVVGHDIGAGVERAFGREEYEFTRTYSPDQVVTLREHLGLDPDTDLLAALGEHFETTLALETFAREHGVEGEFWSRVGG